MKRKYGVIMVLLLAGIFLLGGNNYAQDPNFYIYLCFGQSNMEGQGAIQTPDKTVSNRFKVMEAVDCSNLGRIKGAWYDARPPLCRCYTGLSPADYFGRTMVDNLPSNIKIGIVNVSVAGCKIELFDKDDYQAYVATAPEWMANIINEYGGNPYGRLVEIAKLAQNDGVIKGILLHQGESNTNEVDWPAKVRDVYDSLIYDLGLNPDSVPLLAGEVVDAEQGGLCASMNSIIENLPDTLPNSYVISSRGCTDVTDNLHFSSAGYRLLGRRYATQMLSLMGYESAYLEAECATVGESWIIIEDPLASNKSYATVKSGLQSISDAPSADSGHIQFTFNVNDDTTYHIYARLNCLSSDSDALWLKVDSGEFVKYDSLTTSGEWQWLELDTVNLTAGEHSISIAYCEDGVLIDKISLKNSSIIPIDKDDEPINVCTPDFTPTGIFNFGSLDGYVLGQNFPNPFNNSTNIPFEIPVDTYVSLKVYNILGVEMAELCGRKYNAGAHIVEFNAENFSNGVYLYKIKTDKYSAMQIMSIKTD